jgi:hypothetical protein
MLLRKLTARGKSQVNYRNKKLDLCALDLLKKLVRNIRTNSEKRMIKGSTKDRSVLNYLTLSFLHQSDILLLRARMTQAGNMGVSWEFNLVILFTIVIIVIGLIRTWLRR